MRDGDDSKRELGSWRIDRGKGGEEMRGRIGETTKETIEEGKQRPDKRNKDKERRREAKHKEGEVGILKT